MNRHLDPRAFAEATPRSVTPWPGDHLVGLLVANSVGIILIFVAWWEASGLGRARDQLAWLNLGVLGLVVAGGANGLWLARGRRVVVLARVAVLPRPPRMELSGSANGRVPTSNGRVSVGGNRPAVRRAGPSSRAARTVGGLVSGEAMSFYHRAGCLLVTGKQVGGAGRAEHERAGRRPCEVCRP